jgi:hypothetical protein
MVVVVCRWVGARGRGSDRGRGGVRRALRLGSVAKAKGTAVAVVGAPIHSLARLGKPWRPRRGASRQRAIVRKVHARTH